MGQILTSLVSLGFLVEKWPFCSTLLSVYAMGTCEPMRTIPQVGLLGLLVTATTPHTFSLTEHLNSIPKRTSESRKK